MSVEKGKVLAAIELKLKGKSLSKNFKENIAAKWAEKIETDENIEEFINDREDVLLEASSEADRRATEAAQKAKGENPNPNPPAPNPSNPEPKKDDMPEWAKVLLEQNKAVTEKLQQLEGEKTQQTIQQKAKEALGKDVPELFLKNRTMPSTLEEIDTWAAEVKKDFADLAQATFNSNVPGGRPPAGSGIGGNKKEASKEELDAVGL